MDVVFGLERYRGIQPAGLLPGTNSRNNRAGSGKTSEQGEAPRQNPEIHTISKTSSSFRRMYSEEQELLDELNRGNRGQEKSEKEESKGETLKTCYNAFKSGLMGSIEKATHEASNTFYGAVVKSYCMIKR